MEFDSLLVMSMALVPGVLVTGLWHLVTRRDDELQDCVAQTLALPEI